MTLCRAGVGAGWNTDTGRGLLLGSGGDQAGLFDSAFAGCQACLAGDSLPGFWQQLGMGAAGQQVLYVTM